MPVLRRYSFLLVALFLTSLLSSQTTPAGISHTAAAFQSNVRVVLLDVVVSDGNGNPVTGLAQEDFRVFEDGKPQRIASFKEHDGAPLKMVELPSMQPGTYTNYPAVENADSINVILMDSLNTQTLDQEYVHQQIIKYLKTIPPGARVAIFTLSSRLRMVQEFTNDSTRLLAALNDPRLTAPRASPLLQSQAERQADQAIVDTAILNQMGPPTAQTGAQEAVDPVNGLKELLAEKDVRITEERIEITLAAFQELARYLSGYPGRKNVMWVSGAFPVALFPDADLPSPARAQRTFLDDFQRTADLCTAAQMAIYPVAAEGLVNSSVYEANAAAISQQRPSRMGQNNASLMTAEFQGRSGARIAMEDLAKSTGGQAFYETNGLKDVLKRVTDQGMHYYTVSYTPTNTKMDNRYRQTRVELTKQKYKLSYRRGYYATDLKIGSGLADTHNPLLPLMTPGLPDVSQIIYKLSVNPLDPNSSAKPVSVPSAPKGPTTSYALDFGISLYRMKLDVLPDGNRRANLEVRAIAYDDSGKPLNSTGQRGSLSLTPKAFEEALKFGIQLHEELDVPANANVHFRTGVYDINSGNAGTLGITVRTPAVIAK
jgi:VWFA-related protein